MNRTRTAAVILLAFAVAAIAEASWYDDYDAGLAAARKGNWSVVVQKMSAAIRANGSENNKARAYGTIFYNYHPYYYRGVASLNLGRYDDAIADLEKTAGPGEVDLGPISSHLDRAKRLVAQASEPEPSRPEPARPSPAVVPPSTSTPAAPAIDPQLRQRASAAINATKQKLQAAQQRRATASPQYAQALTMFTDATSRNAAARSNEDLNGVITLAENAGDLAELAGPAATTPPPVASAPVTRPSAATDAVLADYKVQLRRALENYFDGEFEAATRDFEALSRKLPDNGWIWAFLGASQYSQYAFEADDAYRAAAERSFRKARQLRSWKGGLPSKYFSKRIRRAFGEG